MREEKIALVDYIWWFVFAVCTAFFTIRIAGQIQEIAFSSSNSLIKSAFILFTLVVYALLGLGIVFISRQINFEQPSSLNIVFEATMWLVITLLFGIRFLLPAAGMQDDIPLLQAALEPNEGEVVLFSGTESLYVDTMKMLLGSSGYDVAKAFYWQVGLQFASLIMLFLCLRLLAGTVAAYATAVLLVASLEFREGAAAFRPEVAYMFLWSAVFLLMVGIFRLALRHDDALSSKAGRRLILVLGFIVAVVLFYDILGIMLVVTGLYLLYNTRQQTSGYVWGCVLYLIGILLGFLVMLIREAIQKSNIVSENLASWLGRLDPDFSMTVEIPHENLLLSVVMSCSACIMVVLLWRIGQNRFALFAFYVFSMSMLFPMLGLATSDYMMWIAFAWAAAAGIGIQRLIQFGSGDAEVIEEDILLDEGIRARRAMQVRKAKKAKKEKKEQESRYDTSTGTIYLDNPLPLPPKPVRKVMDYPHTVPESLLRYDFYVSDDDDYDDYGKDIDDGYS
ncbi:MAG: hypothetical protein LBI54_05850 [Lachnospiraceae bacterium]|jgi:hypothetical protein|nr:hypothetical protein [Lachnospiraceae bacterium]